MCDLLNLTYDYELENLNREKMNYPGIDLGDRYNQVQCRSLQSLTVRIRLSESGGF